LVEIERRQFTGAAMFHKPADSGTGVSPVSIDAKHRRDAGATKSHARRK